MPLEHGESGVALMKEIKKSLDPGGILNKGGLGL
jgi:FAD/FMN-containing dehydrogenase